MAWGSVALALVWLAASALAAPRTDIACSDWADTRCVDMGNGFRVLLTSKKYGGGTAHPLPPLTVPSLGVHATESHATEQHGPKQCAPEP